MHISHGLCTSQCIWSGLAVFNTCLVSHRCVFHNPFIQTLRGGHSDVCTLFLSSVSESMLAHGTFWIGVSTLVEENHQCGPTWKGEDGWGAILPTSQAGLALCILFTPLQMCRHFSATVTTIRMLRGEMEARLSFC